MSEVYTNVTGLDCVRTLTGRGNYVNHLVQRSTLRPVPVLKHAALSLNVS